MFKTVVLCLLLSSPLVAETKACLLVRPTIAFTTAFGNVGGKYEYVDSFNLPVENQQMKYKKSQLEKLQKQGIHVVLVPRDAVRDQIKQARESCVQEATQAKNDH